MLRRTVTTLRAPANTYRSPSDRKEAVKWGRWMFCENCHYNGDRDYGASVNIARLGVAYLIANETHGQGALLLDL